MRATTPHIPGVPALLDIWQNCFEPGIAEACHDEEFARAAGRSDEVKNSPIYVHDQAVQYAARGMKTDILV